MAHLGGMLFGWLYLKGWRPGSGLRLPSWKEWKESRRQAKLRKQFRVYYRDSRGKDPDRDEE